MTEKECGELYKLLRKWESDITKNINDLVEKAQAEQSATGVEIYTRYIEKSEEAREKVREAKRLLMNENYMMPKTLTERSEK